MIAVSKIEVVAKCIIFCSLMSSQAAPQKCSGLLTANLVMDGQNLSEVEVWSNPPHYWLVHYTVHSTDYLAPRPAADWRVETVRGFPLHRVLSWAEPGSEQSYSSAVLVHLDTVVTGQGNHGARTGRPWAMTSCGSSLRTAASKTYHWLRPRTGKALNTEHSALLLLPLIIVLPPLA